MTDGGRPASVRRHLRRPLWWTAWLTLAAAGLFMVDVFDARAETREFADAMTATATVRELPVAGGTFTVRYFNQRTEQRVDAEVYVWDGDKAPDAVGEQVRLDVSRGDPENVRVAGDRFPLTYNLVGYSVFPGVALVAWFVRRIGIWRVSRIMARASQSFAMVGAVSPPRRWGRFCHLHLWPLDAEAGSSAQCALPLVSTAGLPIGGPAFPVEMKGSPRPMGRVVARSGIGPVWPSGRAALGTWMARPERVEDPGPLPAVGPPIAGPPPWRTWLPTVLPYFVLLAVALGVAVGVTAFTLTNAARARSIEREGISVIGEVTGHADDDSTVLLAYRSPVDGAQVTGRAPADVASDHAEGLRLPARADPDDPEALRLEAEPYDTVEPVAWALAALVILLGLLARRALWWRGMRRAVRAGAWFAVGGRTAGDEGKDVALVDAGGYVRCCIRLPEGALATAARTTDDLRVAALDQVEPGVAVAAWSQVGWWPVVGPARGEARRGQSWRPWADALWRPDPLP